MDIKQDISTNIPTIDCILDVAFCRCPSSPVWFPFHATNNLLNSPASDDKSNMRLLMIGTSTSIIAASICENCTLMRYLRVHHDRKPGNCLAHKKIAVSVRLFDAKFFALNRLRIHEHSVYRWIYRWFWLWRITFLLFVQRCLLLLFETVCQPSWRKNWPLVVIM